MVVQSRRTCWPVHEGTRRCLFCASRKQFWGGAAESENSKHCTSSNPQLPAHLARLRPHLWLEVALLLLPRPRLICRLSRQRFSPGSLAVRKSYRGGPPAVPAPRRRHKFGSQAPRARGQPRQPREHLPTSCRRGAVGPTPAQSLRAGSSWPALAPDGQGKAVLARRWRRAAGNSSGCVCGAQQRDIRSARHSGGRRTAACGHHHATPGQAAFEQRMQAGQRENFRRRDKRVARAKRLPGERVGNASDRREPRKNPSRTWYGFLCFRLSVFRAFFSASQRLNSNGVPSGRPHLVQSTPLSVWCVDEPAPSLSRTRRCVRAPVDIDCA